MRKLRSQVELGLFHCWWSSRGSALRYWGTYGNLLGFLGSHSDLDLWGEGLVMFVPGLAGLQLVLLSSLPPWLPLLTAIYYFLKQASLQRHTELSSRREGFHCSVHPEWPQCQERPCQLTSAGTLCPVLLKISVVQAHLQFTQWALSPWTGGGGMRTGSWCPHAHRGTELSAWSARSSALTAGKKESCSVDIQIIWKLLDRNGPAPHTFLLLLRCLWDC